MGCQKLSTQAVMSLLMLLETVEAVVDGDVDNGEEPMDVLRRDATAARMAVRLSPQYRGHDRKR